MADKKISQLPKINAISGSTVILPIVHDGTTQQMDVSTFALYTSQWSADTGSNTFFGNQIISGNLSVSGISALTGNTSIGGNLTVAGKLTAQELFTEITSASIIFESGSTIFGNTADDTHTITGTIILNGLALGTPELMAQTASQAAVNLRISSTTGSINTTTASFDSVFQRISSTTGSINTTTASFDSVFLGISSFTGSLNSLTASYATTGSNTFRGNQSITGSLSISAGEFNITTGSGNATSSLIFDHTQNDGVTLQLRHNDRLSFADHTLNVNVWAGGVYTQFVRNGTPYSILNVEAFDDNKIYLYRDTRLFNRSLVVDNNLTVQRDVVIGTGSLSINNGQLSITTGSGALTSSLSLTHTTVDPITGDATLALRYRNNQVGSENNAWKFVATDNGVQVRYDQYTTSNKMLFSLSSFGSNFDKLLIWRDVRLFGTGLTVDDSLMVRGVITGSILATNGVVSSSNQLFELNQQTGSQNSVNLAISSVTGSLIGIANGLMAFTAALDNTYATDAQLYQLYQATASVHFTTQSLNTQTGSQDLVNRGISSVTGSINTTTASFDSVFLRISSTTGSINTTTSSFNSVFLGISSVTGAMNTQSGSQDLVNLGISTFTGSIRSEVGLIEAYTASLKAAAIVSSSQQIIDYNTFAVTSSANTFYGNQTISGSLRVNGPLRGNTISGGLSVNGGITGSFAGNLAGVADYASTVAISNVGTTNDTTLYPTFTTNILAGNYSSLSSHASGSFFLNGVTRRVHMEGLVVSGSNNTAEISGSFNVSGSTNLTGSVNVSGSTSFTGTHTLSGSNTIVGNTVLSGSIEVSGSSNFRNSLFIVTGSVFFTGSHDIKGNSSITGSFQVTGNTTLSGSINIASGSSFFRAGNKLFNYGAFYDTTTQSGSANVSSSIKFNSTDYSEGVSITNNRRIVLANVGVYNIQFSAQLVDTSFGSSTIHIWLMKNGVNVPHSAGKIFLAANEETIASWNYVVPATSPNDYYELVWQSTDSDARILYEAATGNIPAIPSIILTVTQVA